MDSLLESIDPQVVLVLAAIAVLILSITLVIRILKASAGLILAILAIVLVMQYIFGITPNQLWGEISNLPHDISQLLQGFNLDSLKTAFLD